MKKRNKKAKEAADRENHKNQLKTRSRKESNLERPMPSLAIKPTILIVCEGKNTEPSYFRQFRLSSATIKTIGEGYNTTSLVNRTMQIAQGESYDQVWFVFDKDDFNDNDFNNAIEIAKANNYAVAYSNQAFEYWLILHFDDHQGGGMHRKDYDDKINTLLKPYNLSYDGKNSKIISEDFFELLDGIDEKTAKERKQLAIERAGRNFNRNKHDTPAKAESSTTVFRLVEEIVKYI